MTTAAQAIAARVAHAAYRPKPRLTVSEFCDREIIVTSGPLAGTRWRTDFAPYQREILDAPLTAEFVVVMGSSQWGKTAIASNVVAYHIAQEPAHMLVVEPTVDPMARDFSRNRLGPMIEASPVLRARMGKPRAKDGTNSITAKYFRNGSVVLAGANSAASLASRSVRVLILDEVDRYPPELPGEGATLEVAIKRTLAYLGQRRVLLLSSPTLRGAPISAWFQRGDQRRYFVPCPRCAEMHTLEWANVHFDHHDPATARLACPACGAAFGDAERVAILARGEWRPTAAGEPGIVSFHLWEAYSPLSSLSEIVAGFLRARTAQKTGDRSVLHSWTNTTLGEPVDPDDGEGVEPHVLLLRRETYGPDLDAPAGVAAITMGVDVQDDRLELLVVGWATGDEAWLIDRGLIPGDTSRPEPWRGLLEVLERAEYRTPAGGLPIGATCIDSAGHRTAEVYDFVHRHQGRRVFATIGRDGQRPLVSSPSPQRWGREQRRVRLYTVGVDTGKSLVASRLMLTEPGPGYVHLPHADWADEELAAQLTSERLVTRWSKGVPATVWKKIRPRNEMLDCFVLALAALRLGSLPLTRPAGPSPAPAPPRAPWIPRRPPGWLQTRR